MCSIFRGYRSIRSIQEVMWGRGLKFVFKFELIIPEIGGAALGCHFLRVKNKIMMISQLDYFKVVLYLLLLSLVLLLSLIFL